MQRLALLFAVLAFLPLACNNAVEVSAVTFPENTGGESTIVDLDADAKAALNGKNTKVTFVGSKPGQKHTGGFKELTGEVVCMKGSPGFKPAPGASRVASIKAEIDATSIYSDNDQLTTHLKNEDFFAIKDYPKIKFVSTDCKLTDGNFDLTTVIGDLTLLKVTKPIKFQARSLTKRGLQMVAEFKFNRSDFGMTFGKGKVDDEVTVRVVVGKDMDAPKDAPKDAAAK